MGLVDIYEDAPYFVDGVEFSGADGNILRNNAIFLDGLTQQPIKVFTHGIYAEAQHFMGRNKITLEMPRAWTGAFHYRSGMTEAVYEASGDRVDNERIRIYHKKVQDAGIGTLVYDAIWPEAHSIIIIDISALGYAENDIIETIVQVYYPGPNYNNIAPKSGIHQVRNAFVRYMSDYPTETAFPGLPTFSGTSITATQLNQLSNAQDWMMNRLAMIPRIPFVNGMFANGTHKSSYPWPANPFPVYYGWVKKTNGQDTLHGIIDYYTYNGQENIKVYVNDVLAYTSPTYTNGAYGTLEFNIDISALGDTIAYPVRIDDEVVSGQGQAELELYGDAIINSRFTIKVLEATDSRSYTSALAEFDVLESMQFQTWKARMNNIAAITESAYDRINNNPELFDRAQMFRRKVGVDDHQNSSLEWMSLPMNIRLGERYIVAGRDVKIAWGGYSLTTAITSEPTNRHPYEFANEKQLIGADKIDIKEGYFDEFEGMFIGSTYFIIGKDLSFFAEYLR